MDPRIVKNYRQLTFKQLKYCWLTDSEVAWYNRATKAIYGPGYCRCGPQEPSRYLQKKLLESLPYGR